MLTRLIGGNRVITLGTAIAEHFLTTMNWEWADHRGSLNRRHGLIMLVTGEQKQRRMRLINEKNGKRLVSIVLSYCTPILY